jgi:HSP20 family protein
MANLMIRSRPFFLTDLQDEINRLFDFSTGTSGQGASGMISDFVPPIDIKDEKDHYLVRADVPGMDPKQIEITINDTTLTIRGEREAKSKETKEGYVKMERAKGVFCRQFTLPESVDAENISAKSKNGVLEITLPKLQKNGSRKISVNVED